MVRIGSSASHGSVIVEIQLVSPPGISSRMIQKNVMIPKIQTTSRYRLVQYQARRRLTMSSSRASGSSLPNRLGHGMKRRTMMSISPRNAITAMNVQKSEYHRLMPTSSRKKK